jgi:hypothetical protein
MTRHLSDEKLMDVLEGTGTLAERAHAAECPQCDASLSEARAVLALAVEAEVPEPPGAYWEVLRRHVGRRIGEERRAVGRLGWLFPFAAATAIVAALYLGDHREPARPVPAPLPAWSALPPAEEDAGLAALSGVNGDLAPWEESQGLGAFVAGLSDEETDTLVEALQQERGKAEL